MRARVVLAVLAVLAFLVIPTTRGEAQQRAAPPATDVTAAEIEAVYNTIGSSIDQQIKVGDVGHGYVGVGVLHRDAIEDQGDTPSGLVHTEVSEIYYMLSGSGTLVTGGTTTVLNYIPANSRVVIELIGPSYQATSRGGYARQISEGDVGRHPSRSLPRLERGPRPRHVSQHATRPGWDATARLHTSRAGIERGLRPETGRMMSSLCKISLNTSLLCVLSLSVLSLMFSTTPAATQTSSVPNFSSDDGYLTHPLPPGDEEVRCDQRRTHEGVREGAHRYLPQLPGRWPPVLTRGWQLSDRKESRRPRINRPRCADSAAVYINGGFGRILACHGLPWRATHCHVPLLRRTGRVASYG